MLEIFNDTQASVDTQALNKVFGEYCKLFDLPDNIAAELTVTDEETIRDVNRRFRQIDSVTDVLSFPALEVKLPFDFNDYPYDVDMATGELSLGEIMICHSRMLEQSREYGHSETRECCYLLAHGLLHLLGFDHVDEQDKTVMREKEEEILSALGITR